MDVIDILAQIFSVIAMFLNIFSYQQKKKEGIIICQLIGSFAFSASYFLLSSISGGVVAIVNIALALVMLFEKKTNAQSPVWAVLFSIAYIGTYILAFALGTAPSLRNFIVELLPVAGSIVIMISFRMKDAKLLRKISYVRAPIWLLYNILVFSIGGILCELFSLCSLIIGTLRHDIKKNTKQN